MQKPVETIGNNAPAMAQSVLPIAAQGLCVTRGGRAILDDVGVSLARAPVTTVLLGPNGAGKSLLIRVLAGFMPADRGSVTWAGTQPDRRRTCRIGFVFQRPVLLRRTALANIKYALAVTGMPTAGRRGRAEQALSKAGLGHIADQPARALSAGEQQRLALARAIACEPEVLILDEPTANLDPASTAAIERLLTDIRSAGTPVLFITHDLGQARRLADAVVFMHRGHILERGPAQAFFKAPCTNEARAYLAGEIVL